MTEPTITAHINQPLNTHSDLSAQVTFYFILRDLLTQSIQLSLR